MLAKDKGLRGAEWAAEELFANPTFGMAVTMVSASVAVFVGLSWGFETALGWQWPQVLFGLGAVLYLVQGLPTALRNETTWQDRLSFTVPLWIARTTLLFVFFGVYDAFMHLASPRHWGLLVVMSLLVGPVMWFALLQARQSGLMSLKGLMTTEGVGIVTSVAVSQVVLWAAVLVVWFQAPGLVAAMLVTLLAGAWHLVGNVIMVKQFAQARQARGAAQLHGATGVGQSDRVETSVHSGFFRSGEELFSRCWWFASFLTLSIMNRREEIERATGVSDLRAMGMVDEAKYRAILYEGIAYAACCALEQLSQDVAKNHEWTKEVEVLVTDYRVYLAKSLNHVMQCDPKASSGFMKLLQAYCIPDYDDAYERFWAAHKSDGIKLIGLLKAEFELEASDMEKRDLTLESLHHVYAFRVNKIVTVVSPSELVHNAYEYRHLANKYYGPAFCTLTHERINGDIHRLMRDGKVPIRHH